MLDPREGYDITTIRPGDTCEIVGIDTTLHRFARANMRITAVEFRHDSAVLTVEVVPSGLRQFVRTTRKTLDDLAMKDAAGTIT